MKKIVLSVATLIISVTAPQAMQTRSLSGASKAFTAHKLHQPMGHHSTYSSVNKAQESFVACGVEIKRDRFGNLWPQWQGLDELRFMFGERVLVSKLKEIVATLKDNNPGKAFMIKLLVKEFGYSEKLKEAGFIQHFSQVTQSKDDHAIWIVKNGSPIPPVSTAISGAKMFLIKDGECLFIEDINMKGLLMIPGGGVDLREFSLNACARELKEETGLIVSPNDMKLLGLGNRINANPYGYSDYCFYYTANQFSGEIVTQESELTKVLWAPIRQVLRDGHYKGLKPTLTTLSILDHLFIGGKKSWSLVLPDLRQQLKKAEDRDAKDIMHLELFPINRE